jgi:predicted metalloprotease
LPVHIRLWSAAVIVVLVAGCGGLKAATPNQPSGSSAPNAASIQIHGDASTPVNKLAIAAIADLQKYWTDEFPKLYGGKAYTPVTGGFYAVSPSAGDLPPCATQVSDIAGNAFYCATGDDVAWDAEGLLPQLRSKFGDFVIPVVLAHEWGHAIQARANFQGQTVTREIQADCFSGAWSAHASQSGVFTVAAADLDNALAGFLELRDEPGTAKTDPSAHGSGFDRVSSFQDGFDNGPQACKRYVDNNPPVIELPFNDAADAAAGGNAPYDTIINGVPPDLEDYWSKVYPDLTGQPWTPLKGVEPFDPAHPPTCGGSPTSDYLLFYCVPEDYIGFDTVSAMPRIYAQGGDFAVATLLATQYGLAVEQRAGDKSDEKTASERADCLAGGWAASVLLADRPDSSFRLSPGDLDKALKALLVFRGPGDASRQGAGFDRVRAYRDGVLNGAKACFANE